MKTDRELKALLNEIDRRSYPAYKETRGSYRFRDYILNIEHVRRAHSRFSGGMLWEEAQADRAGRFSSARLRQSAE